MKPNRINAVGKYGWTWYALIGVVVTCTGCVSTRFTDTSRAGIEQLLVSNAIDSSLNKIDFDSLSGGAVFVDEKYLECSDKKYVVGAVRQRAFEAGCRLVDKADDADIVLELYSGAVGTDRSEGFIGTPAINMPGPIPIQLPEIKLFSQSTQYGTAKLGMVAYDAKTKQALSSGGLARARSNNSNWSVLGIGPFNSGSIREEIASAKKLNEFDQRILLSDRRPPASSNPSAWGAVSPTPGGNSERFVPASVPLRPFPPNAMSPPAGVPPVQQPALDPRVNENAG